jgi:hypothetical protein
VLIQRLLTLSYRHFWRHILLNLSLGVRRIIFQKLVVILVQLFDVTLTHKVEETLFEGTHV